MYISYYVTYVKKPNSCFNLTLVLSHFLLVVASKDNEYVSAYIETVLVHTRTDHVKFSWDKCDLSLFAFQQMTLELFI
jgi:hypothetical protein